MRSGPHSPLNSSLRQSMGKSWGVTVASIVAYKPHLALLVSKVSGCHDTASTCISESQLSLLIIL